MNGVVYEQDIEKSKTIYGEHITYAELNYQKHETFDSVLLGVDRIFLMFPPETNLADYHAFIHKAKEKGIKHIVYLSVKDVQFLPFIPHHKNEKAIVQTGIPYTFLRAGYFMQNLNMFLLDEIVRNDRIFVPTGKGKTSFIDVRDIAEVAACSLAEGGVHKHQKYALTGNRALDFYQIADMMSYILKRPITYTNPSIKFFRTYMINKGINPAYVNVVTGIHIPTKLGLAKGITNTFTSITGQEPFQIEQYLQDYKHYWNK
ncbi:NmrA family transcriptional regulator [Paenibacillus marchantiophytorum]|uniref:NmrA family transcriptional regulator n=1 Tax=Paenibacillus marchantiophytorum TaxID=1619310 RepID=A0ABQ2BTQ3_9BACL|nr:NmrA family NAD(P)-binding protein [Paenibacillus marchantiophytorum]GGI46535.1 NmrA family transcriptional regulator [Paenibacillus marchantiophytorum]